MLRNFIEINVNDYRGDLLLLDTYLQDISIPFEDLSIPEPTITATFSPEALHLDKLGFKMCTVLRMGRVSSVTCVFKEGSPHSIQIPLMIQEAADNILFPRGAVQYIAWDKGKFHNVGDRSIRLCRHAGEISRLGGLFRLVRYVDILRGPSGCPNDRAATFESTIELMKEEIDELAEAVQTGDVSSILEELGDVLYDVILFALIFEESEGILPSDIANKCTDKMLQRHPGILEK